MNITKILTDVLYAVILAVLPIITRYVVQFLAAKQDAVDSANLAEYQRDIIDGVLETIRDATIACNQTFVDDLKTSGEWNDAAKAQAFQKTKTAVLSTLTTEARDIIVELYDDFNIWVDTKIEATVNQVKGV